MKLLIIERGPLGFLTDAYELCRYAGQRHAVTFLSFDSLRFMKDPGLRMALPGVESCTIPAHGRCLSRLIRWISGCRREGARQYDLVYVYYFPGCSLLRVFAPNQKFILDIRSVSTSPMAAVRLCFDFLMRVEASIFNAVNVISENVSRQLNVSSRAVYVLPVGANAITSTPKSFYELRLLYVGNLSSRRRIEDTIKGFAQFYKSYSSSVRAHYTIVGDGVEQQIKHLRTLAHDLGIEDMLEFTGYVARDRMHEIFDRCNVGISYVPITPYYEHQPPTKTYEYLLAGMPVVATATAANREIVSEPNGVLVSDTPEGFCDGLVQLLHNRDKYDSTNIASMAALHKWEVIMRVLALPRIEEIARGAE